LRSLHHKRLNVAGRRRYAEQSSPHSQARQHIVDLSLTQQALRFRQLIYVG
jgi:hypothetical protein